MNRDAKDLREEVEHLRFLLEASPQVPWTADGQGNLTWISHRWEEVTGTPVEAAMGMGYVAFVYPEDLASAMTIIQHCLATLEPIDMEYRVRQGDGSYRWMRHRAIARTGEDGGLIGWYGTTEDVHDRKVAETNAAATLDHLRLTQDSLSLAMKGGRMGWWTRDFATGKVTWSEELAEIFGISPADFGGDSQSFMDFVHPDDAPGFRSAVSKALEGHTDYALEFRFRRADGSEGWMEGRGRAVYDADGKPTASYGLGIDITQQKHAQEAIRQSEAQYRQVAEGLPQLVWSALPTGERDFFNRRWFDYTGLKEATAHENWLEVLHPKDRDQAVTAWLHSIESGENFQAEYRVRRYDGQYRWCLGRAVPIRNDEGEILRWFGTCTDIHDRKATELALAVSNDFAQTLSQDLDLDRIVQALTDAATQAIGAEFGSFFYTVESETGEALLLYCLSGAPIEAFEKFGLPRPTAVFGPTFRNEGVVRSDDITKDPRYGKMGPHYGMPPGHLPVVSYLAISVTSRSGDVIGGLFFGHTKPGMFTEEHERVIASLSSQASVAIDNARLYTSVANMKDALESEVAARTADLVASNQALQGFTYHVAHDLRSPLRTIVSTSRILQEDHSGLLPKEASEMLERQALAAGRLGRLIDDLLRMARLTREEARRETINFTRLADDVAADALATHPESRVTFENQEGMTVEADPRLLRLALGNLVENAVKYSPNGGTIRIGHRDDGAYFVSDEGIGIEPRYFEKIFETFQRLHRDDEFSGTGIGLSNVHQIIARHGGRVWVESELGKGSTFLFTLG